MTAMLYGRETELAVLGARLDGLGGGLTLRGDAGVGKSALLAAARRSASERGMTVLATTGARSEAELPFAGLHQLLLPLLDARPPEALAAAFGLLDARAPDAARIADATLELVGEAAPALLTVDVHWLDRPTVDVLALLARRISGAPVVLLFAGEHDRLGALDPLSVRPLDHAASAALLDATVPGLVASLRARVLAEAAGNPLALVELPHIVDDVSALEPLPLNDRLTQAFAVEELPSPARLLLLLAAAEPGCTMAQLLDAAQVVSGTPLSAHAVHPPLVEPDGEALRFGHPLIASAVYYAAPLLERQAAHRALAEQFEAGSDRRAWHRAAATLGTDDDASAELSDAAARAREGGATMASVAILERAAALTSDGARRSDLLLRAAEQACELGRTATATRLVARTELEPLGPVQRGRLLAIRDLVDPGELLDPGRIEALVVAAEDVAALDTDLALTLLRRAASRCWWCGAPPQLRLPVAAAAERLAPRDDVRVLAILAYADPIARGSDVLDRMAALTPDGAETLRNLGSAALILGDFRASSLHWRRATELYRERGTLGLLSRLLISGGFARCWTGEWETVAADLDEGRALAAETGERFWRAAADATLAKLLAMRGDHEAAEVLATRVLGNPLARGVRFVLHRPAGAVVRGDERGP